MRLSFEYEGHVTERTTTFDMEKYLEGSCTDVIGDNISIPDYMTDTDSGDRYRVDVTVTVALVKVK